MNVTTTTLLDSGPLERVTSVAQRLTGSRPSPSTIWRWTRKGLRGGSIKLQAVFHGGALETTEKAFRQFISEQTEAHTKSAASDESITDEALRAEGLL